MNTAKKQDCEALLTSLRQHRFAMPFNKPVDYVALDIPDYPLVIREPMDLGTIKAGPFEFNAT